MTTSVANESRIIGADPDLEEVVEALYAAGPADPWAASLRAELPWVGISEEAGGVGGTVGDQVAIARAIGRHAVSAPVVESHLAARVLGAFGEDVPHVAMAFTLGDRRDRITVARDTLTGTLHGVAWARDADLLTAVLTTDDGLLACVAEPTDVEVSAGADLAGQPLDTVSVRRARVLGPLPDEVLPGARHALLRAAQIAGAIEACATLTNQYVWTREQFGRPVGSFQAVQAHLVTLEQAAVASRLVVQQAAHAIEVEGESRSRFEAAAAFVVTDHHAGLAAAAAHQAHGAIGMTLEYPLAGLTRRLHSWRGLGARHRNGVDHFGRDAIAYGSVAALVQRETGQQGPTARREQ